MAIKRIVDTQFWEDAKVIDTFSVEDKYFMLYLMTNPRTTQLGIYKLPKRIISFETGYTMEVVAVLIQRFENDYKNIVYNHEAGEIAIINSLKYSIVKGGKPTADLLRKELNKVDDGNLILATYQNMKKFWDKSLRTFDKTVKSLFEEELQRRKIIYTLLNDNDNEKENENDNDNENEDSYHDSLDDSLHDSSRVRRQEVIRAYEDIFGTISSFVMESLDYWCDDLSEELVIEALKTTALHNGRNFKYTEAIMKNWETAKIKTLDDLEKFNKKEQSQKTNQTKEVNYSAWNS